MYRLIFQAEYQGNWKNPYPYNTSYSEFFRSVFLTFGVNTDQINSEYGHIYTAIAKPYQRNKTSLLERSNEEEMIRRVLRGNTFQNICCFNHRQSSRGVLRWRYSENMHQIYRRTPMPKFNFNTSAKQLY